jgi:hypothetical protein
MQTLDGGAGVVRRHEAATQIGQGERHIGARPCLLQGPDATCDKRHSQTA